MPQLDVPVLVVPLVHFFSVIGKARHGICRPMEDRSGLIVLSLWLADLNSLRIILDLQRANKDSGRRHLGATTRLRRNHLLCDCH